MTAHTAPRRAHMRPARCTNCAGFGTEDFPLFGGRHLGGTKRGAMRTILGSGAHDWPEGSMIGSRNSLNEICAEHTSPFLNGSHRPAGATLQMPRRQSMLIASARPATMRQGNGVVLTTSRESMGRHGGAGIARDRRRSGAPRRPPRPGRGPCRHACTHLRSDGTCGSAAAAPVPGGIEAPTCTRSESAAKHGRHPAFQRAARTVAVSQWTAAEVCNPASDEGTITVGFPQQVVV